MLQALWKVIKTTLNQCIVSVFSPKADLSSEEDTDFAQLKGNAHLPGPAVSWFAALLWEDVGVAAGTLLDTGFLCHHRPRRTSERAWGLFLYAVVNNCRETSSVLLVYRDARLSKLTGPFLVPSLWETLEFHARFKLPHFEIQDHVETEP